MAEGGIPTEVSPIKPEIGVKTEPEKTFDFKFYVTDHAPDFADTGSHDRLKTLYADIRKDGIESVRFDWRWKNIEPSQRNVSKEQINRYLDAISVMKEVGLKEPTLVLSSIPDWAKKLYVENKDKFFDAYGQYLGYVKEGLRSAKESKISTVQILNELNSPAYTPIKDPADIVKLCEITRASFADYNPDIQLTVSVLAIATPEWAEKAGLAENIRTFLPKLERIKDAVDKIAIDYYPGGWQRSISKGNKFKNIIDRLILPSKNAYKEMFTDMDLFKEVAEKIASWGKDYELGETGFPVKGMYWGNEWRQRYFYDAFFKNFRSLMIDFKQRGIKLPDRIGLYQAINEPPRDLVGKVMKATPYYPEFNWGMRSDQGNRRAILRGSPHTEKLYNGKESRLSRIISYMNS